MSRTRLEERTNTVVHLGKAHLLGYRHRFSHLGQDGTGKGNIEVSSGQSVYGVLYQLREEQVALLAPFEAGYEQIEVELTLAKSKQNVRAFSYRSLKTTENLLVCPIYWKHYETGMKENSLPLAYSTDLKKQANQ